MSLQKLIEKFKLHGDDFGHICDDDKAKLRDAAEVMREGLECVSNNGEGRGMGWTPAQHSRIAIAKADEIARGE